ncbi:alpha/beta hydrolase [bacterium SCSIO 12741]|nr:alpha/beta hydrolase [bacterium SCSIO 12741]
MAKPIRTKILRKPDEYGLNYEEVTFKAADGVELHAWFIPSDSNKLIIHNHFSPASRYGFPGHMKNFEASGGFEVNFLPKYKALHDAGYNILTYDMRNHGESDSSENEICGVGYWEWQDVIGSLRFAKSFEKTKDMDISLQSMCMGANSTLRAMHNAPEEFEGIKSWILIQPLHGQTCIERSLEAMGMNIEDGITEFIPINKELTGLSFDDHNMRQFVKDVKIPTLVLQVRNDRVSRESDIQEIYDNLEVPMKDIIWIEDTPWRFHGYTYFSEYPQEMIAWYDKFMK